MFVHSYVLISVYFFLEFICEISETLDLTKPLFLLSIVIASDIGGYIVGKLFGNIKISPNISPNKTIEGTFGSIFFTLIIWIIFFQGFASNFIIEIIYVVVISLCSQVMLNSHRYFTGSANLLYDGAIRAGKWYRLQTDQTSTDKDLLVYVEKVEHSINVVGSNVVQSRTRIRFTRAFYTGEEP